MRLLLCVILSIGIQFNSSYAQTIEDGNDRTKVIEHIHCETPVSDLDPSKYSSLAKPKRLKRSNTRMNPTIFSINYLPAGNYTFAGQSYNCIAWPNDAMTAFNYAAMLWEMILDLNVAITVDACWATNLFPGQLGLAGGPLYTDDFGDGTTLYAAPLIQEITGNDYTFGGTDIFAAFNSNTSWYFGTDEMPGGGQSDMVSTVMHELAHGLGFSGTANYDDGIAANGIECTGIAGDGCIGLGSNNTPTMYDRFVLLKNGTPIVNETSASTIGNDLTGGANSGSIKFDDFSANRFARMTSTNLYTPSTYQPGSTYSHFDEGGGAPTSNELMSPSLTTGQAIHDPGLTVGVFEAIGYNSVVPVDLIAFSAILSENQVDLSWSTASEVNNDYFEIERSTDYENFLPIATINGKGNSNDINNYTYTDTDPASGINVYRLKQVDYDGTSSYSNLEVVDVLSSDQTIAIGPNPFSETIRIHSNSKLEEVKISIYDALGKLVYNNGINAADELNLDLLPPGGYVINVSHNKGSVTKKLIKSK